MLRSLLPAAALALALAPMPGRADDIDTLLGLLPALGDRLLREDDPVARISGGIALCMIGVTDPQVATEVIEGAGWDTFEGDGGLLGFAGNAEFEPMITLSTDPGLCLVETTQLGTDGALAALIGTLDALGWAPGEVIQVEGGCEAIDLRIGALVQVAAPGEDLACTSDEGAEIRFTIADM